MIAPSTGSRGRPSLPGSNAGRGRPQVRSPPLSLACCIPIAPPGQASRPGFPAPGMASEDEEEFVVRGASRATSALFVHPSEDARVVNPDRLEFGWIMAGVRPAVMQRI